MISVRPMLTSVTSFNPFVRFKMALITEIHQRTQALIYAEDNVATTATVTTCWATIRYILFPTKRNDTIPAVSALNINLSFIYEH
ncbi:hypothetical protein D3C78_1232350 [compost metagenome]